MINFPKMHIADSVQNRILNLMDEQAAAGIQAPSIPTPPPMGKAIDAAVTQPLPPLGAPSNAEAAIAVGKAEGQTAADALGTQAVVDAFV